jgi:hypothetical protein
VAGDVAARPDIYISADIEADGPIPGPYSMLSFGLAVAGTGDGVRFERADPSERTFYRELRPISAEWQSEALAVSGLDRERLVSEGADPAEAMTEAAEWVAEVAGRGNTPVLVAYPLGFDWMFLYWYFVQFGRHGSPFGHSSALDTKTIFQVKSRLPVSLAVKSRLPAGIRSQRRHTHHALDDAMEQADLFANLVDWAGPSESQGG